VVLDSVPLSKVLGLSLVDGKNVIEKGDPTKGDQLGFPAKISHQQSWWILYTNIMVTKNKK